MTFSYVFYSDLFNQGDALRRQLSEKLFSGKLEKEEPHTPAPTTGALYQTMQAEEEPHTPAPTTGALYQTMQAEEEHFLAAIGKDPSLNERCTFFAERHIADHPLPEGMELTPRMKATAIRAEMRLQGRIANVDLSHESLRTVGSIRRAIRRTDRAMDEALILFFQNLLAKKTVRSSYITEVIGSDAPVATKAANIRGYIHTYAEGFAKVKQVILTAGENGVVPMRAIPYEIHCFGLKILILQGHHFTALPDIPDHWRLETVYLDNNQLTELPKSFRRISPSGLTLTENPLLVMSKFNTRNLRLFSADAPLMQQFADSDAPLPRQIAFIGFRGEGFSRALLEKIHHAYTLISERLGVDTSSPDFGRETFERAVANRTNEYGRTLLGEEHARLFRMGILLYRQARSEEGVATN